METEAPSDLGLRMRTWKSKWSRAFLAAGMLLTLAPVFLSAMETQRSAPPPSSIKDNYHHAAWTSKDGAPAGIWTITQTPDGWLWVGGASGLYRFDGITFENVDLRQPGSLESGGVRSLMTTRRGDLWVSFYYEGAAVLAGGALGNAWFPPGLPDNDYITEFVEDGVGEVWALTKSGARYVLREGKWGIAGSEWGLPAGAIHQAKLDPLGALWVAMKDGIYVLKKGAHRFIATHTNALAGARIGIAQSGQLWKLDRNGYALLEGPEVATRVTREDPERSASAAPVLLARDGTYWSVDCTLGICRSGERTDSVTQVSSSADMFTRADGLSSDRPMTLFEDQEGDIWVGTKQGLDRFRRNDLVSVRFPTPLIYFSMVADTRGGILLGTNVSYASAENYLWRLDPLPARVQGFSGAITAVLPEQDGSVLFGGLGTAWRMTEGQFQPVDIPGDAAVRALARDRDGHLWASVRPEGTFRLDGSQWVRNGNIANLPDKAADVLALDDSGQLWLGYPDNRVFAVQGASARSYSSAQGLSIGAVTAILPKHNVAFFGGALGLSAFDGNRFVMLRADRPEALKGITGILQTRDGTLWVNGNAGAVRIGADDLTHALSDLAFRMPVRVFNAEDGMPGSAQTTSGNPTVIEDLRGRLWFAATDGLAWLDPEHLRLNLQNPRVEVVSIAMSAQNLAPSTNLRLPSGTRNLTIRYTALSLATPERIRFRVRLSGVDKEWRNVGAERSVTYSNLGPGAFTFQVAASNAEGRWSGSAASFPFQIQPAFYQTEWFKVLYGCGVLAALIGIVRAQGARLAARTAARMRERLEERERIARELHDTLIQDVEALVLNLRALSRRFGELDAAHHELSRIDQAAQRSLELARARVGGLRAVARTSTYLKDVLQELAEQLALLYPSAYRVEVKGNPQDLQPSAAEEIVAIGREAILNAFRHAKATLILISIAYTVRSIELTVIDDGRGFSPDTMVHESKGHWGLRGMRERARELGAQLTITSLAGRGTRVHARVAASIAYSGLQSIAIRRRMILRWQQWLRVADRS